MGGSALLDATSKFNAALQADAAKRLGCAASEISIKDEKVTRAGRRGIDVCRLRRPVG